MLPCPTLIPYIGVNIKLELFKCKNGVQINKVYSKFMMLSEKHKTI